MNAEDYSKWTMQQLNERLTEATELILKNDQRGLPLEGLFEECGRIIAAMDKLMEQFKGTPLYDDYWKSRQVKGELPKLPPGFDVGWQ